MIALLIALIYLAFVSLGLPDSLLGSAWPVMHWNDMNRLKVPDWRELDMLRYVGIVVNPRTAARLFRWNYSTISKCGMFQRIGVLENGLEVFVCQESPEDSIRLIGKTDLKNLTGKSSVKSTPEPDSK